MGQPQPSHAFSPNGTVTVYRVGHPPNRLTKRSVTYANATDAAQHERASCTIEYTYDVQIRRIGKDHRRRRRRNVASDTFWTFTAPTTRQRGCGLRRRQQRHRGRRRRTSTDVTSGAKTSTIIAQENDRRQSRHRGDPDTFAVESGLDHSRHWAGISATSSLRRATDQSRSTSTSPYPPSVAVTKRPTRVEWRYLYTAQEFDGDTALFLTTTPAGTIQTRASSSAQDPIRCRRGWDANWIGMLKTALLRSPIHRLEPEPTGRNDAA